MSANSISPIAQAQTHRLRAAIAVLAVAVVAAIVAPASFATTSPTTTTGVPTTSVNYTEKKTSLAVDFDASVASRGTSMRPVTR